MLRTLNNFSENLIIITAPSGAGKTTLIKNILKYAQENEEKIFLSISHTTRKPRKGEINGKIIFSLMKKHLIKIFRAINILNMLLSTKIYMELHRNLLIAKFKVVIKFFWR